MPSSSAAQREPDASPAEREALRLWVVLSRAFSAISELASADVARHGLTLAEFGVLEALYHRGPMLLGEVQRKLLVSSGGVTYLVDRLEGKGFVERSECADDRRARYAVLTRSGEALVRRVFPQHAAAIARAVAGLGAAERRAVAEQLKRLGLHAASLTDGAPAPEAPGVAGRRRGGLTTSSVRGKAPAGERPARPAATSAARRAKPAAPSAAPRPARPPLAPRSQRSPRPRRAD